MTFREILADVRYANICRLKNHAFAANQVGKAAIGKSRRICYRLKSETINALVRLHAASLCTIELSLEEPLIGVQFVGGGKLHTLPSNLDSEAREILQEQLIAAINHGKTNTIGARVA
jgi:signal transduction histidine kinase